MCALYTLKDIRVIYAGQNVLEIPHLDIPENIILGLSGHNGSGKSTLLRLLAFLEDPTQGLVYFRNIRGSAHQESLRRKITLLTQSPYLLKRSVFGNVAYGLKIRKMHQTEEKVAAALDMVGLPAQHFARRKWHELSGGERQRVALASRLVLQPDVLLLDEPTSNLDLESTQLTRQAMLKAREKWGTTLIVVSHDLDWLSRVSHQVMSIHKGTITESTQAHIA
ncbi:MAG: energy-coupling factor ABC transporter ATP-binding protein [Desulfovermiculus sp.]